MEAHRSLVRRVSLMLQPEANVAEKLSRFGRDSMRFDSEVPVRCAIRAGPTPYVPKHALVQGKYEIVVEDVAPALAERPRFAKGDVGLLRFVEVSMVRDPALAKTLSFFRRQPRRVVVAVEDTGHGESQRRFSLSASRM